MTDTILDPDLPGPADVRAAAEHLAGIANRTPVMTSRTVNGRVGAEVYFKCENFQRAGAFKFRGAYHALDRLGPEERRRGVLTYSSGNHAQAVALAGRLLGIPTTIVMPADAPAVKLDATRQYGAAIVTYDRATGNREAIGRRLAEERGLVVIPPYDHRDVIAGQGTAALELFEDAGPLDLLLVCCGGGGLLSGSALAARSACPACRVIGVEPELADDATRSFRTRTLQRVENPPTIADGARTPSLGRLTFPLVLALVHDMVTVSDAAILRAMRFLWERMKIVVEPTGALAAAALFERAVPVEGRRVGVIVSGGNVDLVQAGAWFAAGDGVSGGRVDQARDPGPAGGLRR
jgi:threonine dehydratase